MRKLLKGAVFGIALLSTAVQADWIEESDRHAMAVMASLGKFQPEWMASYGLDAFDAGVMDLGLSLIHI